MVHGNHHLMPGIFFLYVDSYDNGVMEGRFYQPVTRKSGVFESMMQFLLTAEQCMDAEKTPQSFLAVRTFSPNRSQIGEASDEIILKYGKVATFSIHVMFRRGTTWQGSITWLEKKQTQHFRSVLELMTLIDSAAVQKDMFLCPSCDVDSPMQIAE